MQWVLTHALELEPQLCAAADGVRETLLGGHSPLAVVVRSARSGKEWQVNGSTFFRVPGGHRRALICPVACGFSNHTIGASAGLLQDLGLRVGDKLVLRREQRQVDGRQQVVLVGSAGGGKAAEEQGEAAVEVQAGAG